MHRREPRAARRLALIATDGLAAFAVAWFTFGHESPVPHTVTGMSFALLIQLVLSLLGSYRGVLRKDSSWHLYSVLVVALIAAATMRLAGLLGMFSGQCWRSAAALFLGLLTLRLILVGSHRSWLAPKRLWIIADHLDDAHELSIKIRSQRAFYRIVRVSGQPSMEQFRTGIAEVDAIFCAAALRTWLQPLCHAQGKQLLVLPDPSDVLLCCAQVHPLKDGVVLSMPTFGLSPVRRLGKRAVDLAGASVLLLLFAPVMAALYWLIPRTSEGDAIYRQTRRGLRGEPFKILKFRTMLNDAESDTGPVLARNRDHRITSFGQLLRSTRLDELPQLFNVLKGEMSLVGPRPERECFARQFDQEFPEYPLRTVVKPGLTGLAQVWGSYSTAAEDKLRLDLWYIANQSIWLDLQLLLQTARVVMHHEKAAGIAEPKQSVPERPASRVVPRSLPGEAFRTGKPVYVRSKP